MKVSIWKEYQNIPEMVSCLFIPIFYSYKPSTLRFSNNTNGEHPFLGFVRKSFIRLDHHNGWAARLQWEICIKCLPQRQNDKLPIRKSNQGPASFWSLIWNTSSWAIVSILLKKIFKNVSILLKKLQWSCPRKSHMDMRYRTFIITENQIKFWDDSV